jgi:hypothetical protein
MNPALLDTAIVAASLGLFAAAYALAMVATRPARVQPAPATPDLGGEPPAVVSLLANRWALTEDASESTLLDLAARGDLELRQPANDPMHTTIHLRDGDEPGELTRYERRVLDRVRGLAVDGVLPVTALTFRNAQRARRWNRHLHHEVVADARARGLSRRRLSVAVVSVLSVVAAVTAAGVTVAAFRSALRDEDSDVLGAFWVGVLVWVALSALAGRPLGERDTPAGRDVAARWLGVRAWLRAHEQFADLPPAAVTVWDRYLPYGAALGVTHTASAVLDLGLGDRRLVWSSYGGGWRRVRVRYPRLWRRYGKSVPRLLARAGLALVAGTALVRWHGGPAELSTASGFEQVADGLLVVSRGMLAGGVLLLGYGGYVLVRVLLDLATTRTITGEVLWIEKWRQRSGGRDRPPQTWLDYLAVDDGAADRTTAWGLPRGPLGTCHDTDTVTIRVRPWSRRVVALTVVEPGRTRQLVDAPVEEVDNPVIAKLGSAFERVSATVGGTGSGSGGAGRLVDQVLTAEEVGEALGMPVRGPQRLPIPGPLATATFTTVDRDRQVLIVGVASGRTGQWMMRSTSNWATVPGVGDEARMRRERGAVRVGDSTVSLTLTSDGRARQDALPVLLRQAAARIPRQREPG